MPLGDKALWAYRQLLDERRAEYRLYQQLPLPDALRLKLERLFGTEQIIELEEETDSPMSGAVIEELHFLGFRTVEGDIHVLWIMECPSCKQLMPTQPLTSLTDLGQAILLFGMTRRVDNHVCPSPAAPNPSS
jgi:hypothetical protein